MWIIQVEDRHGRTTYGPFSTVYDAEVWAEDTVIDLEWSSDFVQKPF